MRRKVKGRLEPLPIAAVRNGTRRGRTRIASDPEDKELRKKSGSFK